MQIVPLPKSLAEWRIQARGFLKEGLAPETLDWTDESALAWGSDDTCTRLPVPEPIVPQSFFKEAELVAHHRSTRQWNLLYRILWRITHGSPKLLEIAFDTDVLCLQQMSKEVRRDLHKMTAFIRFRKLATDDCYVAWYEPDHPILQAVSGFFVRRFGAMRWSIFTPDGSAYWDTEKLHFEPGNRRNELAKDSLEDLWQIYYAAVYNPLRTNPKAMTREMPKRFWKNLPESAQIPALLRSSKNGTCTANPYTQPRITQCLDIETLRDQAHRCTACPLHCNATQTVFGSGSVNAQLMLVGEQPGDEEDKAGKAFIGPAGEVLAAALIAAGLDRNLLYTTNAVKHFKFTMRGKKRLHQKPRSLEIAACRPWLQREIELIHPKLIVCLGATAAQSVLGRSVKVLTERGKIVSEKLGYQVLLTIHPAAVLRAPSEDAKQALFSLLIDDIKKASHYLEGKRESCGGNCEETKNI